MCQHRLYKIALQNALLVVSIFLFSQLRAQIPSGQQLKMKDFSVYSGFSKVFDSSKFILSISYGVKVNGGNIGSHTNVQIKNNNLIKGKIYSGNTIIIEENNIVEGDIVASNRAK